MGKLILLPCVALLVAAGSASANPPALTNKITSPEAQQAGGGKAAPAAEEKKICKQLDSTGSRLPRRACLTEREWKQLEDELQR